MYSDAKWPVLCRCAVSEYFLNDTLSAQHRPFGAMKSQRHLIYVLKHKNSAMLLKSVPCATFKICFKSLTYYLKCTFFEKIVLCMLDVRYDTYLLVNIIAICLYYL